ncbi:Protein phosphatase 1 regulatory subunit pprA isoform F, partial [Glycine soja]
SKDPSPHDNDRYSDRMLLEVEVKDFRKDCISYAYLSLDSAGCKGISFTLAAITKSNYSRTSRRVWGDEEGVIWLCVLRRSKSSDIWRLCRVSVGLSLDYG